MKKRVFKRFGLAVAFLPLMLGWVSPSQATVGWYVATISAAGPVASGQLSIRMSDTASPAGFTNQWFFVLPTSTVSKEILGVALTAISLGSQVYVNVDPALAAPVVFSLYLCDNTC